MIRREFLGWSQPPLRLTLAWLVERGEQWRGDLSDFLVVVPTSLAKRRLEAELAGQARREKWSYYPPEIITVGSLPEHLYVPKRPFADAVTQRLVWAQVLQEAPRHRTRHVIGSPPAEDDQVAWCRLGDMLGTLRRELAGDRLDCRGVLEQASTLPDFRESARWEALAELEQAYLDKLDQLELWDKQAARLEAIRLGECHTRRRVVLAGTVDLNRTMRAMIDAVADQVTSLVFAPPSYDSHFDSHGCLVAAAWENEPIELPDGAIRVAEGPAEVAGAVAEAIRDAIDAHGEPVTPADIVIGVPDERLLAGLRRAIAAAGGVLRYGPGRPLTETSPVRLWEVMAAWLSSRRADDFSDLIRHPAVHQWLEEQADLKPPWLADVDRYCQTWLPAVLDLEEVRRRAEAADPSARTMRNVLQAVDRWLRPLGRSRPLSKWGEILIGAMRVLLEQREFDTECDDDRPWLVALSQLRQVATDWRALPEQVDCHVSAGEALRWLVESCRGVPVPQSPRDDAIEAHGWLELPWDDAPIVIVAGMNEGVIPQFVNADPFLPNRLRQRLGLDDNLRRFARDCFATRLLLESHPHVRLIAARRNTDGDPLLPSRLWFCRDADAQLRAVRRFLQGDSQDRPAVSWLAGTGSSPQEPPRPQPLTSEQKQRLRTLRVTQFRDYLACPYRFYLRHVLRLESMAEATDELDALAFGSLAHDVLRQFGESEIRDSSDAEEIARFLVRCLKDAVESQWGEHPLVSVQLQQELLRERLCEFAHRQANEAADGWRIIGCELKGAPYAIAGEDFAVEITGRIDRIDWHAAKRTLRILDYKTGDSGAKPDKTHRRRRGGTMVWIDLQLPLYRHLLPGELREEYPAERIELGYVLLPKTTSKTGFSMANWKAGDLNEADDVARAVAESIWHEEFWPPSDEYRYHDEFSEICMEDMLT